MTQRITSTLSGQKEVFEVSGRPVRMYVCGMTPKYHPHVGHARVFVAADILRRYLEYRGYEIVHVQNFTDVDDKIIARAQVDGITPGRGREAVLRLVLRGDGPPQRPARPSLPDRHRLDGRHRRLRRGADRARPRLPR